MIGWLVYDPLRGFMEGRGVVVLVLIERRSLREAVTLLVDPRAKCAIVAFQLLRCMECKIKDKRTARDGVFVEEEKSRKFGGSSVSKNPAARLSRGIFCERI